MIESITKLSPEDLQHVLSELHRMGVKSGKEYIRYSHRELSQVAAFLDSFYYQIDERQADMLLSKFNNAETILFKRIINSTPNKREGLPAEVKKMTSRTRLAINRILNKQSEENEKSDVPASTKLQQLMSTILPSTT